MKLTLFQQHTATDFRRQSPEKFFCKSAELETFSFSLPNKTNRLARCLFPSLRDR